MNSTEFLKWLPPHIREQHLNTLKGCTAVRFPAAYWMRVPQSQNIKWVTLSHLDSQGMVVKTGPGNLVMGLIKAMEKYQQEFETMELV
jgi:hypothetical protein